MSAPSVVTGDLTIVVNPSVGGSEDVAKAVLRALREAAARARGDVREFQ